MLGGVFILVHELAWYQKMERKMEETATRMPLNSGPEDEEVGLREGRLYITQSPYYSPVFNGAVFDGPIRIYFSQTQEALALKFYFELRSKTEGSSSRRTRVEKQANVFIMVYPTDEVFELCFLSQGLSRAPDALSVGRMGRDHVIALLADELEEDRMGRWVSKVARLLGELIPPQEEDPQ